MKKLIGITLFICFLTSACGGAFRVADPVDSYQHGDDTKSCESLRKELKDCKKQYERLAKQREEKIAVNVVLGAGSLFFLPLMLLMDASDVDMVEINAQKKRYMSLTEICTDKQCGFSIEKLPEISASTNQSPRN